MAGFHLRGDRAGLCSHDYELNVKRVEDAWHQLFDMISPFVLYRERLAADGLWHARRVYELEKQNSSYRSLGKK
jgi:hypothetical protein